MEKVIVNVGKTTEGYSASIDILPGWVLGMTGSFAEFKEELQKSIAVFIKWAKKDGNEYPAVFDKDYAFEYKFDVESLKKEQETKIVNSFHHLGKELLSVSV